MKGGALLLLLAASAFAYRPPSTSLMTPRSAPVATRRARSRRAVSRLPQEMVGFFSRGRSSKDSDVAVTIERLAPNIRRISGTCVVDRPIREVWAILSDYDNLSKHVPNLVQSRLLDHPQGGIRLFQEGAQKIVGLDFRASLVMDMMESPPKDMDAMPAWAIKFALVESRMFAEFFGEWRLVNFSRKKQRDAQGNLTGEYDYSTKMFYTVTIRPRGVVPVAALEWRIREDVPTNMLAVRSAAERVGRAIADRNDAEREARGLPPDVPLIGDPNFGASGASATEFEAEETLAAYMARTRRAEG